MRQLRPTVAGCRIMQTAAYLCATKWTTSFGHNIVAVQSSTGERNLFSPTGWGSRNMGDNCSWRLSRLHTGQDVAETLGGSHSCQVTIQGRCYSLHHKLWLSGYRDWHKSSSRRQLTHGLCYHNSNAIRTSSRRQCKCRIVICQLLQRHQLVSVD